MADRVGQRLGQYRLLRLLGKGGFAEVYLGEHVELGTQAAVKVLNSKISLEEVEQFRKEARTIAHLRHPHIVGVFDFGVEAGVPYLIMQYAPGGTLRDHFPRGVQIAPVTLLPFVQQVAEGLHYAHAHKLVHRDIKPENLLLDEQGEVLISDFGIAVLALSSRLQSMQEVAGTAAYMAPEQIKGKAHYASDQYALGVVIYEWITGERPFQGPLSELLAKHLHAPPPPLHEKAPLVSPVLETVVLTALAKDPRERFQSTQAFARAFEIACGEPHMPLTAPVTQPVTHEVTTPSFPRQAGPPATPLLDAHTQEVGTAALPGGSDPPLPATVTPAASLTADHLPALTPGAESPRRGVSRRTVLACAAGVAGVVLVGGAAAWLGLTRHTTTGGLIAQATATPAPRPTISLTPSATPLPTPIRLNTPVFIYPGHKRNLDHYALAWSPEPGIQRIASGAEDGLQVWDAFTGANAVSFAMTEYISGLALSPTGHQLAVSAGGLNGTEVLDASSGATLVSPSHLQVNSLSWSPDGQRLASGSSEPFVQVWPWQAGGDASTLWSGHKGKVNDVAWSPTGKYLASGSQDQTAIVWDAASGTPLQVLKAPDTPAQVVSVAWSSDDTRLAVGDQIGMVWVWALLAGKLLYSKRAGPANPVYALAWSPDGQRLAASASNEVAIWEAGTGNLLVIFAQLNQICSLAWSPDSNYLASGSFDSTVQIWQPG
jgi:serine/threonine protein kinase